MGPYSVNLDVTLGYAFKFSLKKLKRTFTLHFQLACDVFCLSSITPNEAFGIVLVKAMSCGKPVISTQLNNGVKEVNLNEITVLIIPPENSKTLALSIEHLQLNPNNVLLVITL